MLRSVAAPVPSAAAPGQALPRRRPSWLRPAAPMQLRQADDSCRSGGSGRAPQAGRWPLAAAAAAAGGGQAVPGPAPLQPVIKVCGVTNTEDAAAAAAAGAHLVGMILWPRAKRSIPPAVAAEVSAAARAGGAEPVAVFVDEDAATIERVCAEAGVRIAQLHGDGARAALAALAPHLDVVYVMHADAGGNLQTPPPPAGSRRPRWIIVDGLQGGSGEAFDWARLRQQAAAFAPHSSHGWLLAGGLTPDSVAEAIGTAAPTGVDVSSGVCGPDGLKKDPARVAAYCGAAAAAFCARQGGATTH